MTKAEFIAEVHKSNKKSDVSKKQVADIIDCAFETLAKAIKKDKRFSYPGFGTFSVKKRKARKGRNPQTGEEIRIAASKTVGFKPAPKLKGLV